DERAALEVRLVEPLVEDVEDREELVDRRRAAAARARLDATVRPELFPSVQEGDHEIVLPAEMLVERCLGDGGPLDDLVDADAADAPPREELVGAVEDSRASGDAAQGGLLGQGGETVAG